MPGPKPMLPEGAEAGLFFFEGQYQFVDRSGRRERVRYLGPQAVRAAFAGEGVETILSVGSALQSASLAACLTANHLAVFEPPDYVRRLLVAHDNDDAGRYALARLTCRLVPRGIDVLPVPPRRNDFNDDLRADGVGGLRETLSHCLDQATIERLIGA